jgi:hypothetical protein
MKVYIIIPFILILSGCFRSQDKEPELTNFEWKSILENTLVFAEGDLPLVYKEYDNLYLKDLILKVYTHSANIGYTVNDSIENYIKIRQNTLISNDLGEYLDVKYVLDSSNVESNFVIYSEPFYVSSDIVCISMTCKKPKANTMDHWVFLFQKQGNTFKIKRFYDYQKDSFFSPASH